MPSGDRATMPGHSTSISSLNLRTFLPASPQGCSDVSASVTSGTLQCPCQHHPKDAPMSEPVSPQGCSNVPTSITPRLLRCLCQCHPRDALMSPSATLHVLATSGSSTRAVPRRRELGVPVLSPRSRTVTYRPPAPRSGAAAALPCGCGRCSGRSRRGCGPAR